MFESVFAHGFPTSSRLASVRAAAIANLYKLPAEYRRDLEQEALLELWRKHTLYDAERGSWRTFSERVVANRLSSLVRHMRSERSGQFREAALENLRNVAAPDRRIDIRLRVSQVLARVSPFDRTVALHLTDHSAIETSQELGISRATVYRAMVRLRIALAEAGLSPRKCSRRMSATGKG